MATAKKKSVGSANLSAIQVAMQALQREKIDVESAMVKIDSSLYTKSMPCIPSGSVIVDYLIGGKKNQHGVAPCPGFPRGRITMIYGKQSSGKTTLALTTAATTCALGGTVCYIDYENDVNIHYARSLGVPVDDVTKFILLQPDTLDEGIAMMHGMVKAGVDLLVVDSVGAGVAKAQADKTLKERADAKNTWLGAAARKWSEELPDLKKTAMKVVRESNGKKGAAIIGIAQMRAKINTGSSYGGDPEQAQGGNAWRYFASVMIKLQRVKKLTEKQHDAVTHKTEEAASGALVRMVLDKNKVADSMQQNQCFYLRHGTGIDDLSSLIAIAQAYGVIKRKGAWYSWVRKNGEEIKGQGMTPFYTQIDMDEELYDELHQTVIPHLAVSGEGGSKVESTELDDLDEVESADDLDATLDAALGSEDDEDSDDDA